MINDGKVHEEYQTSQMKCKESKIQDLTASLAHSQLLSSASESRLAALQTVHQVSISPSTPVMSLLCQPEHDVVMYAYSICSYGECEQDAVTRHLIQHALSRIYQYM